MKMSYDYEMMIRELKEDLGDGVLSTTDVIKILRADKEIYNGYKPIITWYYEDEIADEKTGISNISVENCIIEMEEWNKII